MKCGSIFLAGAFLAATVALLSPAWAEEGAVTIDRIAWLQGCWESAGPERTVEEQWMAPRGGSMMAMGRTTAKGAVVEYELVVVRQENDRLAYHAHPSGQPSAVFHSIVVSETSVVFENLEHDFPQRVGYQRQEGDRLLAWIEGNRGGEMRRIEFPYQRAQCAGPAAAAK
jgi:hypothetical protein